MIFNCFKTSNFFWGGELIFTDFAVLSVFCEIEYPSVKVDHTGIIICARVFAFSWLLKCFQVAFHRR